MKKFIISVFLFLSLGSSAANAWVGEIVLGVVEVVMPIVGDAVFESDEKNEADKANAQKSADNLKKFFTGEDSNKTELEKLQDDYEKSKKVKEKVSLNETTKVENKVEVKKESSGFFSMLENTAENSEDEHQKRVQEMLGY